MVTAALDSDVEIDTDVAGQSAPFVVPLEVALIKIGQYTRFRKDSSLEKITLNLVCLIITGDHNIRIIKYVLNVVNL